jgi:HAE1 family hydrophobic/amphiphilic exporter-1
MAALGFTVNLSTLFGIILAIGIVVDDAIVVVEATSASYREGTCPATTRRCSAMNELLGPIIGITLVLMSVFLPAAFLPGLTGRMYAQFALVIAVTAFISAVNAATLEADAVRRLPAHAGADGEAQLLLSRLQQGL